jgi:hypothetical protein
MWGRARSALWRAFAHDSALLVQVCVSPDARRIATLDAAGTLTVWRTPTRAGELQPLLSYTAAELAAMRAPQLRRRAVVERAAQLADEEHLVGVQWWSDGALSLLTRGGALSVRSLPEMRSLLGAAEHFHPLTHLSAAAGAHHLFALECVDAEVNLPPRARHTHARTRTHARPHASGARSGGADGCGGGGLGGGGGDGGGVAAAAVSSAMRSLAAGDDEDGFEEEVRAAKRQWSPLQEEGGELQVVRTYRLSTVTQTTPEQLFQRKLELGLTGDALELAQEYGLNSDKVYQWQVR